MYAIAKFNKNMPFNKLGIHGNVLFHQKQEGANTLIRFTFSGLKPNAIHAIHIHETSDFSNGCMSTGGHYNPFCSTHGCIYISGKNRHVGDLINNIVADNNGNVFYEYIDDLVSLYNPYSVINRSVVIHEKFDDLGLGENRESLITGNAGGRVACARIERI
jgi:Cu-Zn family superoxide dismutase